MDIVLTTNYKDPESDLLEIVERKWLGHPDTLADGLAHAISSKYSKYTLEKFGLVLHHNVDKLYIGGGMFKTSFGKCEYVSPINVVVNGRMSTEFSGERIDTMKIQKDAISEYLKEILPRLDVDNQVKIDCNSNTFTDVSEFWYKPRNIDDLPEYHSLMANDTAVCTFSFPPTTCEKLAFEIEQYFWIKEAGKNTPKFNYVGQDIKVMVSRIDNIINVVTCIPILSTEIQTMDDYYSKLLIIESELQQFANSITQAPLSVSVKVNPGRVTKFRKYILGIGSCVECGEEGLVGRWNNVGGIISIFRPHTMESSFGKNPKYHTGRVLGYLAGVLSKRIYLDLCSKNTVTMLTNNQQSLIPPYKIFVSSEKPLWQNDIEKIWNEISSINYTDAIINSKI